MNLGKGMVKECATFTFNLRRNAKPWGIATMVRKPLIKFDKPGSIHNQKGDNRVYFLSKF